MATEIPSTIVPTGNVDAGTDNPATARADINTLIVAYNQLIAAMVGGSTMYSDENEGVSSGLDAGTLDGQDKAFFQTATNINTGTLPLAQIPATLTGKDADTLDGQHGSYYRNAGNLNAGTVPEAQLTVGALGAKGILELASSTEMTTGTDGTRPPSVSVVSNWANLKFAPIVTRSWSDVGGSRATSTVYTNSSGNDMQVSIVGSVSGSSNRGHLYFKMDGVQISHIVTSDRYSGGHQDSANAVYLIVPSGSTYEVTGSSLVIDSWWELS